MLGIVGDDSTRNLSIDMVGYRIGLRSSIANLCFKIKFYDDKSNGKEINLDLCPMVDKKFRALSNDRPRKVVLIDVCRFIRSKNSRMDDGQDSQDWKLGKASRTGQES
jgi:hypothetical protein